MSAREFLDRVDGLANAATEGPWMFGTAPAEGSKETPAEFLTNALRGEHPLYVTWTPQPPAGYEDADVVIPAVTGDGPKSRDNAEFIAASRTAVPKLTAALRAVLDLADDGDLYMHGVNPHRLRRAITDALGGEQA